MPPTGEARLPAIPDDPRRRTPPQHAAGGGEWNVTPVTHTVDRSYPWQLPTATGSVALHRVRAHATSWVKSLRRLVMLSDFAVVLAATGSTHLIFFGTTSVLVSSEAGYALNYLALSVALIVAWMAALAIAGSRDHRILGTDTTEYRRVVNATLALFGALAVITLLAKVDVGRGFLLTAFPLGLILLVTTRWGWRRWLHAQRRAGELTFRVLLVGSAAASRELITSLAERTDAGYRVVGAVITDEEVPVDLDGIRTYVGSAGIDIPLAVSRADAVIVAGGEDITSERINELSWKLDPGQQLVVAPQLVGVTGNRIHTRPVAGLPLIHVETPSYDGWKVVLKRAFDIVGSAAILAALSPVFIVVAILVKATSRGPVFYGQERIGMSGEPFTMRKFRSMVTDADAQLAALLQEQGTDGTPLFKVKDDPRVTRVGKVLRRYSIDELPQLINVLVGDMSLVGPRPQRDGEVRLYDTKASRRLVVKPGMSGLWQVSGRSNLSWEDAIRLDLYYVENWSLTGDIIILLRTAKAVFGADGAY